MRRVRVVDRTGVTAAGVATPGVAAGMTSAVVPAPGVTAAVVTATAPTMGREEHRGCQHAQRNHAGNRPSASRRVKFGGHAWADLRRAADLWSTPPK